MAIPFGGSKKGGSSNFFKNIFPRFGTSLNPVCHGAVCFQQLKKILASVFKNSRFFYVKKIRFSRLKPRFVLKNSTQKKS